MLGGVAEEVLANTVSLDYEGSQYGMLDRAQTRKAGPGFEVLRAQAE